MDCCYQDDDIYDRISPYLTYAWSFCYGLESEFDGDCVNDENGDRKKILNILQDRVVSVRPDPEIQPVPIPETDGMGVSDEGKRTWKTNSDIIPSSIIPNDIDTIVLGGRKTKKNSKNKTQRRKQSGKKRGKKRGKKKRKTHKKQNKHMRKKIKKKTRRKFFFGIFPTYCCWVKIGNSILLCIVWGS